MKRWRPSKYAGGGQLVENARIDAFLAEVETVSKKHGLAIAHEDQFGAFLVVDYEDGGGLEDARDCTEK